MVILAAVINWNGWRDTLACVRSMRDLQGPGVHLLLCDNGSTDGSPGELTDWVLAELGAPAPEPQTLPGGAALVEFAQPEGTDWGALRSVRLLRLPTNLGYAGAINLCLQWGRSALAPDACWILNNDVWLEPQALAAMVDALAIAPQCGLVGSVLLEWDPPHAVQAIAGKFQHLLAVGAHLKTLPPGVDPAQPLLRGVDYPVGASLLASRAFIERVGPMDADYFLYYEEMDWAQRGRACGFEPAVALGSRVRHREGASTGSAGGVRHKSMLSEYYGVRNRLRYTRKFSPVLLPVVWASLALVVADRLAHREWRRAALVARLMLWPRSAPRP